MTLKTLLRLTGTALLVLAPWLTSAQSLPPKIEADRQLQAATAAMNEERIDWPRVRTALEAAEATGQKMPEHFDFYLGTALNETGDPANALQRLGRYLSRQGDKARFYKPALEQFNAAERRQAQKQEAEQRARKAEADRIAAEATAKQEQEAIDRAWEVRYFRYWIMDTEGRGRCSNVQSRIDSGVNSKATRQFNCECRTEDVGHPAWRGHTNDVCRGSVEVNWKLDPKGDLPDQSRTDRWGIRFRETPFNF